MTSHGTLDDDDNQARGKTTRPISVIKVSYERASRINYMSLGFIGATPILAPTALKMGAEYKVALVGEVFGIALPYLQYAGHLITLVLVYHEYQTQTVQAQQMKF